MLARMPVHAQTGEWPLCYGVVFCFTKNDKEHCFGDNLPQCSDIVRLIKEKIKRSWQQQMKKTRYIRFLSIISVISLAATALAGCSTASTGEQSTAEATASPVQTTSVDSDAVYVQVQSVDGDTITGILGTMTQLSSDSSQQGTPPDMSSGDSTQQEAPPDMPSSDNAQQGTPPDMSSSDNGQQGTPSDMPSGDSSQQGGPGGQGGMMGFTSSDAVITFSVTDATVITKQSGTDTSEVALSDIAADDILSVTLSNDNVAMTIVIQSAGGGMPSGVQTGSQPGANFGGSDTVTNGTAATTIDADSTISQQTYTSSGDDENALRIDGATVTLEDITVEKTGGSSSNTENGDFYGMNAGLLALNGATATISGATVTTNAVNGNGVFSYGTGTTVNISDSKIRTTMNNSGGIQTTGGATMNATNLDVETQGNSAAAIRSDRGGGDVNVTGGSYTTNGTGSPAIYSTADISVDGATLTANASEAVVVEGKNSVTLNNVTLTGNMQASTDASENVHNIMIYQSMSGDAEVGHSSFTATGGSIIAKSGDQFYVTNTTCTISLTNVALTLANDTLLQVVGNNNSRGWGTAGANGGTCTFNASNQTMSGNIIVDDISSLDLSFADGSVYTGAINTSGAAGTVNVTLGSGCQWVLTGDSYISSFTGDVSGITTNGYTVYVDGTAITD